VSDAVAAENLVKEAAQKLGGCDIFIQSVCPPLGEIYEHVMATELSLEKWQRAFDTQARAFFVGARTAAQFMRGGGRIIGMSYSQSGRTGGATVGGNGIGEGSNGQYQPVLRGGARAAWDHGEYGEPWNVGCRSDGTDSARVPGCREGMGRVRMDAYAKAWHSGGYCGRLCAALQ